MSNEGGSSHSFSGIFAQNKVEYGSVNADEESGSDREQACDAADDTSADGAISDTQSDVSSLAPTINSITRQRYNRIKKYAEEGDWTWRIGGFIAGILVLLSSSFSFVSNALRYSVFEALLDLYLFFFGLVAVFLEVKENVFPSKWLTIIKREALFLYKPYGRAGFYFLIGILLANKHNGFLG